MAARAFQWTVSHTVGRVGRQRSRRSPLVRAMLGRPYVALVALATVLRAERVADDGWLPQCTVDFEYASCFPCRSTDAAAVLKERCLFVSALMNATNCVFEDGFFNSTAGANVT